MQAANYKFCDHTSFERVLSSHDLFYNMLILNRFEKRRCGLYPRDNGGLPEQLITILVGRWPQDHKGELCPPFSARVKALCGQFS